MLKIIHGADFHLDSPFAGLAPERAAQRREEQRALLDRLSALARERQADLVLLAGDLLDSRRLFRETVQALSRSLGEIPCPVFIAPGNHDFYSPGSPWTGTEWPANVHIFTSGPERVDLPKLGCTLYGWAFTDSHRESGPLAGFRAEEEPERLKLAVLHGEVEGGGHYGPIRREEIAASGLDYLALGHIHRGSGLQREGDTFWAYPGCPEGRGFDELGDKGVLYVEAEPGHVTVQPVPLCRRRYHVIPVELGGEAEPLEAARSALPSSAGEDVVRLVFQGEAPAPDLARLERELSHLCYGLSLVDQTRLPRELWTRRGEDSLTGLFLQAMWERCQAEPDSQLCQLAARYGLAALENGEEVRCEN